MRFISPIFQGKRTDQPGMGPAPPGPQPPNAPYGAASPTPHGHIANGQAPPQGLSLKGHNFFLFCFSVALRAFFGKVAMK